MLPKTPQSYRVSEPQRSEIIALMRDLDLVLVRKSFEPLPPRIVHEYSPLPKLVKPLERRPSPAELYKRNHSHVYKSRHDSAQLSFSWD